MINTFNGVYQLKNNEPKDKSSGPILKLTFQKPLIPEDGEKLMRLFGKYVKFSVFQAGTNNYHKIECEAKVYDVKPKNVDKHSYLSFVITMPYGENIAVKSVKLWDKECEINMEEIEQELPLDEDEDEEPDEEEESEE